MGASPWPFSRRSGCDHRELPDIFGTVPHINPDIFGTVPEINPVHHRGLSGSAPHTLTYVSHYVSHSTAQEAGRCGG